MTKLRKMLGDGNASACQELGLEEALASPKAVSLAHELHPAKPRWNR
ncbi:hypothetical protein [Acutalibacter sp.]|nr:hypothetical protein [Acutalibacter sp.]